MKLSVELSLPSLDPLQPLTRAVAAGSDWKFTTELQDNELFYRTKLNGSLKLTGADFAWLKDQWEANPCCVEIAVDIYTPTCDDTTLEDRFWSGYFLMTAVRWDFNLCTAEVREILPRDGYDALFRVWQNPVDIINETQPLDNIPFTAKFANRYFQHIDDQGNTETLPYPDGNVAGSGPDGYEHTYGRGMDLVACINRVLFFTVVNTKAAPLGFAIVSDFLTSPINPVTGRTNYQRLMLAGSDAKRPASITPAVKLLWTLKDLLSELKALFNLYYYIDPATNQLRIEHYSWFAQRSYQNQGRVSWNLNKYPDALKIANNESVDLDDLYGSEELTIANNSGSDWYAYKSGSVRYNDLCTVKNDKGEAKVNSITVNRIYTDLQAGYAHADSVPDDSVFICEIVPKGTYPGYVSPWPQIVIATNDLHYANYTDIIGAGPNGYLTASMLFVDYHRHGRSFTSGLVNAIKQPDGSYAEGMPMAMLSTTPTRRQENISIPLCCADLPLNLDGYVKTNRFNDGRLDKGTFDPAAETFTLDVVAGSRCQSIVTAPPDPQDDCKPNGYLLEIRIDQTYCDQEQMIIRTNTQVHIYADGNCGTYEIADPITITADCK